MHLRQPFTDFISSTVRRVNFPPSTLTILNTCRRSSMTSKIEDYSQYLNEVSKKRKPSAIRALQPLLEIPEVGMISLGGGMPHPSTFPFSKLSVTLQNGKVMDLSEKETAKALQYSQTSGIPEFSKTLRELQVREHSRPVADFDICVTNGSQEGIFKAFECLLSDGDSVLVESPTYSGTLAILKPLNVKLVGVEVDEHGIVPEKLSELLDTFGTTMEGGRKPKVLYTVATASNPTGVSTSFERKQKVYAIARQHGLLIMEDDPYYYLQFNPERIKSYFSIDDDLRVLRFDSFSKILSSGMRLGFVTGPKPLVNAIMLHSQASNLHANGISQMLAWKLLSEQWKLDGFFQHVREVCDFYRKRRDFICKCLDTHLKGKAEWSVPDGGMFVWIKLAAYGDTKTLIRERAVDQKVLFLPGGEFMPNGESSSYVRAAFSTASEPEIEEAIRRLAVLLKS